MVACHWPLSTATATDPGHQSDAVARVLIVCSKGYSKWSLVFGSKARILLRLSWLKGFFVTKCSDFKKEKD